jgi:peroxiredoxin
MKKRYGFALMALLAGFAAIVFLVRRPAHAPVLQLTALNGQTVVVGKTPGKKMLLNFWATDCPGCVREMPQLADFYRRHQTALEIVAIAMPHDPPAEVAAFSKAYNLPFPVVLDNAGQAVHAMQVSVTPTSFLLDEDGRIVRQFIGEISFGHLEDLIAATDKGTL